MESIVIFFTVLSGVIAFYTYYQKYIAGPQKVKKYFIGKIEIARKLNNELLEELKRYVDDNDTSKEHFMQGFSFGESITMLETYRDKVFSEENIKMLDKVDANPKALEDIAKKAEEHVLLISQCKGYFHKFILKEDWHYEQNIETRDRKP